MFDVESNDWKARLESLKKIQQIALLYNDVAEGNSNISY